MVCAPQTRQVGPGCPDHHGRRHRPSGAELGLGAAAGRGQLVRDQLRQTAPPLGRDLVGVPGLAAVSAYHLGVWRGVRSGFAAAVSPSGTPRLCFWLLRMEFFDPAAIAALYWLAAMLVGIAVASLGALRVGDSGPVARSHCSICCSTGLFSPGSAAGWRNGARGKFWARWASSLMFSVQLSGLWPSATAKGHCRGHAPRFGRPHPSARHGRFNDHGRARRPCRQRLGWVRGSSGLLRRAGVVALLRLRAEYRGENLERSAPRVRRRSRHLCAQVGTLPASPPRWPRCWKKTCAISSATPWRISPCWRRAVHLSH